MALADEAITLPLGDLHPDPENPRLRPEQRGELNDDQLMVFIAETYEPVVVAEERQDADAVIGFRHIAGIIDWKPLQRAQFIAYLVDVRDKSFLEVADTVGEEEEVVKMLYRNQGVIARARELGREDLADAS